MAPSGQPRRMRPRDIRFTQDSIGSRFTDGRFLSDTFEQLLDRTLTVERLEWIEVVEDRSLYWALTGNRRLYLYRKLEDLGVVTTIPVQEMSLFNYGVRQRFNHRNTTTCDGVDIEMRQPQAERYMNRTIAKWKTTNYGVRNLIDASARDTSRHLPTEASHGTTSVNYNESNRVLAQGIFNAPSANRTQFLVTTQPSTSIGFPNRRSEPTRPGSDRSTRTGSVRSDFSSSAERDPNSAAEPVAVHSVLPRSNLSVGPGLRPKLTDLFYDGYGPNLVASSSGYVRSSSTVRSTPGPPLLPDRSNFAWTGSTMGAGVAGGGVEREVENEVVTYQPSSSTGPVKDTENTGFSCWSCCSCCF